MEILDLKLSRQLRQKAKIERVVQDSEGLSSLKYKKLYEEKLKGQSAKIFNAEYTESRAQDLYQVEGNISLTAKQTKMVGTLDKMSMYEVHLQLNESDILDLKLGDTLKLSFLLAGNELPLRVDGFFRVKGTITAIEGNQLQLKFCRSLLSIVNLRKKAKMCLAAVAFIFLLWWVVESRAENILYFRFNKVMYGYSLITALYLITRYTISLLYKPDPLNPEFTPGVSIIIPCFNEEEWIQKTISSCFDQCYPPDKLEVILVDDCSSDLSYQKSLEIAQELRDACEQKGYPALIQVMKQPENAGKRDALADGVKVASFEYVVFVDSDSFLEPDAIINLVQPFQDPKMGGVTGRCDIANNHTNLLAKMQEVRYYTAFRVMKAAEAYFHGVTCLSGPLSCYKKYLVEENLDAWLNQTFLKTKATFGDDRALTNLILKNHRTYYQDSAVCCTIVPTSIKVFHKQQIRWKRSWLRETLSAMKYIWKKEPLMSIFFYMGFVVPILSPFIFIYNMLYVPLVVGLAPTYFLKGLLMMGLLMSVAYLMYRKENLFLYGLIFCVYYACVLLWQMPYAVLTFWKSEWGTRATANDVTPEETPLPITAQDLERNTLKSEGGQS